MEPLAKWCTLRSLNYFDGFHHVLDGGFACPPPLLRTEDTSTLNTMTCPRPLPPALAGCVSEPRCFKGRARHLGAAGTTVGVLASADQRCQYRSGNHKCFL